MMTKVVQWAALAALVGGMGCGPGVGISEFNDEELRDRWQGDHPAPRGVVAMSGREGGENLVRFAPVPWAEEHRVEGSRTEGFEGALVEVALREEGLAVHQGLENGERWHYRVIAVAEGDRERVSEVVSATPRASEALKIYVEMEEEALEALYSRDPHSDELLEARAFVGAPGEKELQVEGIRFRGSTTRTYERKSFNIRLEERPEVEGFNFFSNERGGGNRVLLNAMWTDSSGMREALSFSMYRGLGLPAPGHFYGELFINGVYEGLYIGLERVDREALRGWGLNRRRGGFTMVRDESKANRDREEVSWRSIFGADLDAVVESDEEAIVLLQELFNYRGEREDQNWEGLLELIRWVRETPAGGRFAEEFEERFDVEAFIDFLAIHVITHDRDSLDIDYWLYRDEDDEEGRWILIPWDKNLTFGAHYYGGLRGESEIFAYERDFLPTMGNGVVSKFLATSSLRRRFDARLTVLLNEVFTDQWLEEKIEAIGAEIGPAMGSLPGPESFAVHPSQHPGATGWWPLHLETLKSFLSLRRSYLMSYLGADDQEVEGGGRVVGEDGWVRADLEREDGEAVSWSVEIVELEEGEEWVGIDREWRVGVEGVLDGEMVLYWRNSPQESWYRDVILPGHQWYMDAHIKSDDGEWERVSARVMPFGNQIRFPVRIEEEIVIRVGY